MDKNYVEDSLSQIKGRVVKFFKYAAFFGYNILDFPWDPELIVYFLAARVHFNSISVLNNDVMALTWFYNVVGVEPSWVEYPRLIFIREILNKQYLNHQRKKIHLNCIIIYNSQNILMFLLKTLI